MKKIKNYDLAISEFLADVKAWLDKRVPRDSTEDKDIKDTKEMWAKVCENPKHYVQYGNMYTQVCGHTDGFTIRNGVHSYDSSMLFVVISVLTSMDAYYRIQGDKQKEDLAEAIAEYKNFIAKDKFKNKVAQFKRSLAKLPKLLPVKQR